MLPDCAAGGPGTLAARRTGGHGAGAPSAHAQANLRSSQEALDRSRDRLDRAQAEEERRRSAAGREQGAIDRGVRRSHLADEGGLPVEDGTGEGGRRRA